jgi:hypothetical protein
VSKWLESIGYNVTTGGHIEEDQFVKHVGVREFRDRATGYLKDSEPLAVERHGRLIGFYIPVESREPDREVRLKEALGRLEEGVARAMEESGMSEDELAEYFDLSRPPPESPSEARERAAGRRLSDSASGSQKA